jgi:YbbR domain-containing protein
MTRALSFLLHNWPLKLAAIVLAALLYGVLVFTQDTRQISVNIPIVPRAQPETVALLSNLGEVSRVRFFAPDDVDVDSSSFNAWVDFGTATVRPGTTTATVRVEPIDERVDILEWEPRRISVTLDEIVTRLVPIRVALDTPPEGFELREPQIEPPEATVRGAASAVRRVDRVETSMAQIDPSGLNFNRDVELMAVDAQGEEIPEVDVEPSVAHVEIPVIERGETRTLPVTPVISGQPAPGFVLGPVTADPLVVTIDGDADEIAELETVPTVPLSVDGASRPFQRRVDLDLPPGIVAVDRSDVRLSVEIEPFSESRNFTVGLVLEGARADRRYAASTDRVVVTLHGATADLDRLREGGFAAEASVAGLNVGRHNVDVAVDLPAGVEMVAASPPRVVVTVSRPAAASSAAPGDLSPASPSPAP